MSEQEATLEETSEENPSPTELAPPESITGIMLPPPITGVMLIRLRQRVGMTQAEMARGLRVTRQTVCEWERGRRAIPPRQYTAILDLLDVAAATLDTLARRLLAHPLAPLLLTSDSNTANTANGVATGPADTVRTRCGHFPDTSQTSA